jgi:hypothetical protein
MYRAFPNVKEIHLEWTRTVFKFEKGPNRLTEHWKDLWKPGAQRAFLENEDLFSNNRTQNIDYSTPYAHLKVWYLDDVMKGGPSYYGMRDEPRDYKTFITGALQWIGRRHKPLCIQVSLYGAFGHDHSCWQPTLENPGQCER